MSGSYRDDQIHIEHTVYVLQNCIKDLSHSWCDACEHVVVEQNKADIRLARLALDALEASISLEVVR